LASLASVELLEMAVIFLLYPMTHCLSSEIAEIERGISEGISAELYKFIIS
jgi:hypothetical protein